MDIDNFISLLKKGKILKERDVKNLCIKVIEILAEVFYILIRNLMFNQSVHLLLYVEIFMVNFLIYLNCFKLEEKFLIKNIFL